MRIAIVGGKLQGLEAVYLAREAGYEIALIDKDPTAPAVSLVHEFHPLDVIKQKGEVQTLLKSCDLILPTTENYFTLCRLEEAAGECGVPVAFDRSAYRVTCSKILSNQLFERLIIPTPLPWPDCGFPVIVKPSGLSGSTGVFRANTESDLQQALNTIHGDPVIQACLEGPSYSLEVIANEGDAVCFQVTELAFDAGYDCKRVISGPGTGHDVAEEFCELGERIASAVSLSGIMDIEVIASADGLRVLEIDARLPSQTPAAVYHSTGINLLELLVEYSAEGTWPPSRQSSGEMKAVIYEHLRFKDGILETAGENILKEAKMLRFYQNQFSANVMVSNFEQSPEDWSATCIFQGDTETGAWRLRDHAVKEISKAFKARAYLDPSPI
jgi:pyrrolysine biosynthesis protein PylC